MEKFKTTLYVTVGIPGSGKSTMVNRVFEILVRDYGVGKIVSRDEIRYSLVKEDEPYFSKEKEVFKTFIEEIKEALKQYNFVVADATHINRGSRTKLLRALGSSLKDVRVVALVMSTNLETCLERNEQREGRAKVPEESIINMHQNFTIPECEEGFDEIWLC